MALRETGVQLGSQAKWEPQGNWVERDLVVKQENRGFPVTWVKQALRVSKEKRASRAEWV